MCLPSWLRQEAGTIEQGLGQGW
ncbi:hypothetical protein E2C01_102224 [Portunus trituberculatus]|uniref:Uncharacterized protein n=1 Tax=Portunus trituberculatus TaxID=210409 RepID=A0A5B7KGS1_PORTR|nr:hypothetical protein [Portunus trituberculatus]